MEKDLQMEVAVLLDYLKLVWCHVPNEGKRSPQYAVSLKRQGVKAGVPDILIFDLTPGRPYRGVALELKYGRNRQSPEQKEWQKRLEDCGWYYEICYTAEEVYEVLKKTGVVQNG